jgi:hypothetical protein
MDILGLSGSVKQIIVSFPTQTTSIYILEGKKVSNLSSNKLTIKLVITIFDSYFKKFNFIKTLTAVVVRKLTR